MKTHLILNIPTPAGTVVILACGNAPNTKGGRQRGALALHIDIHGKDWGFSKTPAHPCSQCSKVAREILRQEERRDAGDKRIDDEARS